MRFSPSWLALLPTVALLGAGTRQPATHAGGGKNPPAKIKSVFLATPPTIDGQATEWTDSLQYDANSKLQYLVLNDARTMYLRVKINDTPTQAKFAYLGTVVWLDSTGRNQQQLGIRFPLPIDLESLPKGESNRPAGAMGPSAAERLADHQTRLRQVLLNAKEMELLNFRGSKEPVLADAQSLLGVKAAISLDPQGNLIYELAVPLRLVYKRVPSLASGQSANVGVTLSGMKPKMPKDASGNSGSMYDASNSGMGGYGRGMGSGMRGGPQYTFSTFNLKTSAQLAGQ